MFVASPGGRDWISCRTESDDKYAEFLRKKAKRIIYSQVPLEKYRKVQIGLNAKIVILMKYAHDKKMPERNCKTCAHSTPVDSGKWSCAINKGNKNVIFTFSFQILLTEK